MEEKLTPIEEEKLIDFLIQEKGMTLHFYYAGVISQADINKMRGIAAPVKIKDEDKCGRCKCLLNSPTKGDIRDKEFNNLCTSCGDAQRSLNRSAGVVTA